jgi:hypothetical protein
MKGCGPGHYTDVHMEELGHNFGKSQQVASVWPKYQHGSPLNTIQTCFNGSEFTI